MSKIELKGITYNYPDPGSEQGWGQDATEWAKSANDILNGVSPEGSVTLTKVNLPTSICNSGQLFELPGLSFNQSTISYYEIEYVIFRGTSVPPQSGIISSRKESSDFGGFFDSYDANHELTSPYQGVTFLTESTVRIQTNTTVTSGASYIIFKTRTVMGV